MNDVNTTADPRPRVPYDDIPNSAPGLHPCVPEVFEYKYEGGTFRAVLTGKYREAHSSAVPVYVVEVFGGNDRWLKLTRTPPYITTLVHDHIRPMRRQIVRLKAEKTQLEARIAVGSVS